MSICINKEIVAAYLRGERDYMAVLQSMELVRAVETAPVHVDHLNDNQQLGYENYERTIRDPA